MHGRSPEDEGRHHEHHESAGEQGNQEIFLPAHQPDSHGKQGEHREHLVAPGEIIPEPFEALRIGIGPPEQNGDQDDQRQEYDIDYLDFYYDELEGQTVLLGVDSLKDIWAIDGKSWHILGIELHRGALSTFSRYLNLPSRTIPVWSILLTLFFFFLVYAKVFGQDKRWGAFFARFYDCFVLVIPIILFLLFYHSPTYRYNIWFWRVSAFLLAEILISTLLYPTLPTERQ